MTFKAKRIMAEKLSKLLDANAADYMASKIDIASFRARQGGIWDSVYALGLMTEVLALIRHLEKAEALLKPRHEVEAA